MKVFKILLSVSLLVYLFFAGYEALHDAPTYDEPHHMMYGEKILRGDSNQYTLRYSPMASHMPVSALNALPSRMLKSDPPISIFQGRFVTILFSLLIGWIVYRWAKKLYGENAAYFSASLFFLDPNMHAHAHLVTTDIYAAGMITAACYTIWRCFKKPGLKPLFIAAFVIALSQLVKYTALMLLPCVALLCAFNPKQWKRGACLLALSIILSVSVINAAYFFNQTHLRFGEFDFRSGVFQWLQSSFAERQLWLPGPYLYGLDTQLDNQHAGSAVGNIYLLGQLRITDTGFQGFPFYFFILALFKTPIASQLFFLWALAKGLRGRLAASGRELSFLAVPSALLFLYFNIFFKMQVGFRYYLVIFPFLYIYCGSLLSHTDGKLSISKKVILWLLAWIGISNISYFPHSISYANELIWDRKQAYRYFADSNVDWGQDWMRLKKYLSAHPEAVFNPGQPTTGRVVVRLNDLVGVTDPARFLWLRENHKPVGRIAYSYLIFDIPDSKI